MKRGYVMISGPLEDDGRFAVDDITFTFGDLDSCKKILKCALEVMKKNAKAERLDRKDVETSGRNRKGSGSKGKK